MARVAGRRIVLKKTSRNICRVHEEGCRLDQGRNLWCQRRTVKAISKNVEETTGLKLKCISKFRFYFLLWLAYSLFITYKM